MASTLKDTRPLWERALAARGALGRRRRAPLFMQATVHLKDTQFVDLVRALIGLRPLHAASFSDQVGNQTCGSYVRLESLRQRARHDCECCGGSGYFDGEHLEMRCPCTGVPQRKLPKGVAAGGGNPSFGYGARAFRR